MEKTPGNDFSFPVTKTPQLETRLLELPKEIKNMEISLYKTKTGQIKDNIKIKEIKKEVLNEIVAEQHNNFITRTDEELHTVLMEKLRSNAKYQILIEKHNNIEEILELGAIELRFLNNYFTACKAISRMV